MQTLDRLTPTPGGLMLAGILLAKRATDGTLAISGREERIHALISAAYGEYASPRVMSYIKRVGQLFAEVSDEDLEYATYPFPRPQNAFSGNDAPAIAKLTMMLALTGLGSMEDKTIGAQRMRKVQRAMYKSLSPLTALRKLNIVPPDATKYSPDQPRDDHGRWTDEGNTQVADAGNIKTDANADNGKDDKFNVQGAVQYIQNHAAPASTNYCARYVANAIEQGGGLEVTDPRPDNAKDFGPWLESAKFSSVVTADADSGNPYPPQGYTVQAGDVAVIQPYPGGNPAGHMAMYDGTQWISDFIQIDMWGGKGYRSYQPAYVIYRR